MKLFGKGAKLNIIDWILILLLIAVIAFVAVRFLARQEDTLSSTGELSAPNLRFVVICEELDPVLAQNVRQAVEAESTDFGGQALDAARLYNSNKLVDAKIISVQSEQADDGTVRLFFTIEGCAELSEGSYSIGTQELRIGKTYYLKTLDTEIDGYILSMEKLG